MVTSKIECLLQAGNSGEDDDRAAESFTMKCKDDSTYADRVFSGTRGGWVEKSCPAEHVVCGLQTAVQANDGQDRVGLMDILLHCCPLNQLVDCGPPASSLGSSSLTLTPPASTTEGANARFVKNIMGWFCLVLQRYHKPRF